MTTIDKSSPSAEEQPPGSNEKHARPSKDSKQKPCPVVGIGASAGGFHAVQALLSHLPVDTGMALVLIQHLKAGYDSNLPSLLAKSTSLPIFMAEDNIPIRPNQVYILPPGQIMEVKNRRLHLSPRTEQTGKFRPIDHFFTSLAQDCKEEALIVILSGSGSDGSAGLRDIKAEGGIILAQDETSAEFPEMPRHAVETGLVDLVLPPEQIATTLGELCRHPHLRRAAMILDGARTQEPETFSAILQSLQRVGVDFSQYKQNTVRRRITRRMALHRITDPEQYTDFIRSHPEEIAALKEDMLIKVTAFFRDPEVFAALRQEIFPQITPHKDNTHPIRIWVPGCATGEEAYSLAISLLDFMAEKQLNLPLQIFGTDLSETAINKARKGIYSPADISSLSGDQLTRYFVKSDSNYQIKKDLREHCIFAQQDFTRDPPFSRIDLISCRNVLIYLGPELQKKVISIFHYALAPEGFLVLGSSESIGRFDSFFRSLDKKHRIYTKIRKAGKIPLSFTHKHPAVQTGNFDTKRLEPSRSEGAIDLQSETDRILLQKYQPAAVVVDGSMNILHFRGETSLFLEHLPGKASLNLIKMIKDSLRIDLLTLIHKAQQEKTPQIKSHLRLLSADGPRTVSLEVTPFSVGNAEECLLIQFEQKPGDQAISTAMPEQAAETATGEIERLKNDLLSSHEYTQSLIEEKEMALEELKAANEEILSSNEELQSINEELETAKEELESANEELVTVNQELQGRNDELSRANDDLQNLILSADIPFIVVDRELHIQRSSPRAETIFNVRTDDIGRSLDEIRPAFDVPELEDLIHQTIDSGRSIEREILDRPGRWNLLRVRPYTTAGQQISGAVITLIDIDRLKRSHEEIEKAHKYALRIVDTIRQPLLVLSPDLHILTANPSFYEHFQVRPQETEGQQIYQLGTGQWNNQEFRSLLEDILPKSSKMDNFLVQFDFPHLGSRSMLLSARKMSSVEKKSETILLAIEDVTQQLRMQEDLRNSKRRAEDANKAKSEFLANMSHEIRTPMTIILSAVEALQTTELNSDQQNFLEIVHTSAHALTDLLGEILDLARIEANKMHLDHAPFNIRETAESSINILRGEAQRKGIKLSLNISDKVPEVLFGDRVRLRQVLVNLVGNAIKFTEQGVVSVQMEPITDSIGRPMLSFCVSDTGVGIPADKLEAVFAYFTQVDASNTRKYGGTGLGLAICKGIVERMNGSISVTSIQGQGSRFTVTIPLCSADKEVADECSDKEQNAKQKTQVDPYHILIVENEPLILKLIEKLLSVQGWKPTPVGSGKQALQILQQKRFDLILMDLHMPDMDGIQVAKEIREQERKNGGHLPIIALTAYADKTTKEKCLAAGMDDYVTKPFSKDKLLDAIRQQVENSSQA